MEWFTTLGVLVVAGAAYVGLRFVAPSTTTLVLLYWFLQTKTIVYPLTEPLPHPEPAKFLLSFLLAAWGIFVIVFDIKRFLEILLGKRSFFS